MRPRWVFSLHDCKRNIEIFEKTLAQSFPEKKTSFFFAVKANENPRVRDFIFSKGVGAEVLSLKELREVRSATPARIICNGFGKSREYIQASLSDPNTFINLDSEEELREFYSAAAELNVSCPYGIRIQLSAGAKSGISLESLLSVLQDQPPGVTLEGIHFHVGWNPKDDAVLESALLASRKYTEELATRGFRITLWNIGGGFAEGTSHPDQLSNRMRMVNKHLPPSVEQIFAEPGRFLVGDAGAVICSIIKKKGGAYCVNTAAYLHRLTAGTRRIKINPSTRNEIQQDILIYGFWPSENDSVLVNTSGELALGDEVHFLNLGAYLDTLKTQIYHDPQEPLFILEEALP